MALTNIFENVTCTNVVNINDLTIFNIEHTAIILGSLWRENCTFEVQQLTKSSFFPTSLILTQHLTMYVEKTLLLWCHPGLLMVKTLFTH